VQVRNGGIFLRKRSGILLCFGLDRLLSGPYIAMLMLRPCIGQRWISASDPALGLGVVLEVDGGRVTIHFPAVEVKRAYALESAPLVRVRFEPGDVVMNRLSCEMTVDEVIEEAGLLIYTGGGQVMCEDELLDTLSFIRPEKRLLAAMCDSPKDFDFRLRALEWNERLRKSDIRGFAGARIDLIPHQLAIIAETASRLHPRVMLADEVGLGKTIEACLIMHHLQRTGRAARVLILVPEPLVHQWFVELLRRFNLMFALFDEERCESIELNDPEANPFLDSQLILAATDFLVGNETRVAQAIAAGFDLLIVDEAHHLEWSVSGVSPAYAMVESLAVVVPSLLLLTATPQQLGPEGHFARLRLLDPDRYSDLGAFANEVASYGPLAEVVENLKHGSLPDGIERWFVKSPRAALHYRNLCAGDESVRQDLVEELIDLFGTGRVLFRNTREHLKGFPERLPQLYPLGEGESPYAWLADLLRRLPEEEKVLLITSSPEAAIGVQEKLLAEIRVESALFHEDLSLLQRDRNAAWFADGHGARILICSEIGSEGRNFQFARHLVLFGLPRDPELLEQRIGRLDRIGQVGTVRIHVPYGIGSRSELQARWLHEGLDAFREPLKGATALASVLLSELDAIDEDSPEDFEVFLERSRSLKQQIGKELSSGHDRLLELGAPSAKKAQNLKSRIEAADVDRRFEQFVVTLFDRLGLDVSDLFARSYHFHRGHRHSEAFADLPEEGLSATFDRATALAREDLAFLTQDHPVFSGALEQLLDSESGNASFALWESGKGKAVLLECAFVIEWIAPPRLHLDRFLPPTLVRLTLDHQGERVDSPPPALLKSGDARKLVSQAAFRQLIFPKMLEAARRQAELTCREAKDSAARQATALLDQAMARLQDLALRNPQVTDAEIGALSCERAEILTALKHPRLRLDALRLIWRS